MTPDFSRRTFLRAGSGLIVAAAVGGCTTSRSTRDDDARVAPTSSTAGTTPPAASTAPSTAPTTVAAAVAAAGATQFRPVRATRIADTDRSGGWSRIGTDRVRVTVAGRAGVPRTATAAALSVTGTAPTGVATVALVPAGHDTGGVFGAGPASRATCFVMLDGGAVDVLNGSDTSAVTVDVLGYFEPVGSATSEGRMVSVEPTTVLDTAASARPFAPGETRQVTADPAAAPDASAVVVLVSAGSEATSTRWTLHPSSADDHPVTFVAGPGSGPTASTVVALDGGGFDVTSHDGGHVSIDVVAYVTGAAAAESVEGFFVPMAPMRVLDTRQVRQPVPDGSSREVAVGPERCGAFALNVTSVAVDGRAAVTAWDAGGAPALPTGRVGQVAAGTPRAQRPVVPAGRRGVAVGSWGGEAHVVVDVYGWFTGDRSATQVPVLGSQPLGIDAVDMESQADEWLDYGTSGDGRPLRAFRHGSGDRVGLITTALHGDEHTGTSVLADLITHDPIPGWTLWLIPVANPDARAVNQRFVHDVDMNRDFPAGWTPLPVPTPSGCVTTRTGPVPHSLVESQRLAAAMIDGPFRGATISISHHDNYNWVAPQSGSPPVLRELADAYALATGLRLPGENGSIVPTSPRTTNVKGGFETFADSLGMSSFLVENKAGYAGDDWCAGVFGVQPEPAAVTSHHEALRALLTDGRLP
jgi:hypothetical protein